MAPDWLVDNLSTISRREHTMLSADTPHTGFASTEETPMNPRRTIMRLLAAALLLSLAGGLLPADIARAAGIVYVKPGGAGIKDGSSWTKAKDLQPALTAAAAGDQLWVAAGRYTPSATDRNASFAL